MFVRESWTQETEDALDFMCPQCLYNCVCQVTSLCASRDACSSLECDREAAMVEDLDLVSFRESSSSLLSSRLPGEKVDRKREGVGTTSVATK